MQTPPSFNVALALVVLAGVMGCGSPNSSDGRDSALARTRTLRHNTHLDLRVPRVLELFVTRQGNKRTHGTAGNTNLRRVIERRPQTLTTTSMRRAIMPATSASSSASSTSETTCTKRDRGCSSSLATAIAGKTRTRKANLSMASCRADRISWKRCRSRGCPELQPVGAEQVAFVPQCAECGELWLPADAERWRAYLDTTRRSSSTAPIALSASSAMVLRDEGELPHARVASRPTACGDVPIVRCARPSVRVATTHIYDDTGDMSTRL
jgi:hypothetical protein